MKLISQGKIAKSVFNNVNFLFSSVFVFVEFYPKVLKALQGSETAKIEAELYAQEKLCFNITIQGSILYSFVHYFYTFIQFCW